MMHSLFVISITLPMNSILSNAAISMEPMSITIIRSSLWFIASCKDVTKIAFSFGESSHINTEYCIDSPKPRIKEKIFLSLPGSAISYVTINLLLTHSPRIKNWIFLNFPRYYPSKQSGLNLKISPITDRISKIWMGYKSVHSSFVSFQDNPLSTLFH